MSSFADRLVVAMGPGGFDASMRRSVQTAVLFEAKRCLAEKLPSLRPFQRKIAFYDMATYLVQTLPLSPRTKEEVMYRTASSKEALTADTAWKRTKVVHREIEKLIRKIRPLLTNNRSFEEACESYVQSQYEQVSGNKGKPHPRYWEHSHSNVFLTYRMYYRGADLDPNLPPPRPPKPIVVPAEKPKTGQQSHYVMVGEGGAAVPEKDADINEVELEAIVNQGETSSAGEPAAEDSNADNRRGVLKEVRDHIALLKEFEGVIPPEELNKRKRDLFLALPPAPPPALPVSPGGRKKTRIGELEGEAV